MISLLLVQLANYLPPLLILPYISRVLGINGFGVVSIILSISAIIYVITDYGFSLSSSYWIAKHRVNKKNISYYIGAIFVSKTILMIIISVFLFFINLGGVSGINEIDKYKIWIFFIAISQAYQPIWFFQGMEKMKNITIFMVSAKVIYMIFVFLFVKGIDDLFYVFLSFALSNLFATIISIYLIYKAGYYISFPYLKRILRVLQVSTPYFLSRASVGLYTSANTFLVGTTLGVHQAALYSSAEKLYQSGQSLLSPISQSLFPYLARTKDLRILIKIVLLGLIPMLVGVSICWVYADKILLIFFGQHFDSAGNILRIFMLCSIITFITGNFGYPAFSIYGRLDLVNKSVYFSGIIQLTILGTLLISGNFNIENVALSILFVEFLVMLFRVTAFTIIRKKVGDVYASS
ncbi:oligosaccharide flippase family protein [Vibrio cholerae]|uniref:oligosaccharide flippase family protein n=2 Tax=Vibrio cholerae TaxID=666 RepID=UPI000E0A19E0|nr:oligosaccharide flippase family protein [Vibrio cholerae]